MNNQQGGDPRFIWNKGWLFLLDVKQCEWACMSCERQQTDQSRSHRYAHHTARPRWAWPLTLGCRIVGQMHAWLQRAGRRGSRPRQETYAYRHIPEVKGHNGIHVHRVGNDDSSHSDLIGLHRETGVR